ncbi:hypothetical protein [Longimicrobium terrae]|uniref:Uncharacterized protein n=1 Tax=Longimicrobium terrae TaxID=1639882 RepID=A0A841GU91_9BACT|nr:hypothetical protein [Longimicrobium terrae]MBB4635893.1 hypothetical protein [Longimicrobium terrae]MBB6070289.1 hypothetical protein [Longimicrobium terrae]NNC30792.1 hypothetical protein [Longimicrobium terrae]
MPLIRHLIGISLIFSAHVAHRPLAGQTQQPLQPDRRWQERLDPRKPLSGVLVPGVMSGSPAALAQSAVITVRHPGGATENLCISVQTQDGLYTAEARFLVPAGAARTVRLMGPTRYRGELRRYQAGQLVISATLGGDCRDELAPHVVPQWGEGGGPPSPADDIFLYVNSRDFTDVNWRGPDGRDDTARCYETGDSQVTYRQVCRIPAARVRGRTELIIRQRRDGGTYVYNSVFVVAQQ